MERLTHERNNGLKFGYWSPEKKEDLVQRLAAYEDTGLTPEEIMDGKMLTGWIPVEERMPEKPKENPKFDNKPLELYLVSIKNSDYAFRAFWNGVSFADGWSKLDILAWMPLPEPYKPESQSCQCGICDYAAGGCPVDGNWRHCEKNFRIEREEGN